MAIETARVRSVEKPWGVSELGLWGQHDATGRRVGELHFERRSATTNSADLLVKVLLTASDLSVQVHPDDAYAEAIGLLRGKTEAWYILRADAGAKVAVGLNTRMTRTELRTVISDGSIAEHLAWHSVAADDVILIPAGTIHAIGAGIVLVEIQQNSNSTFRISDPAHARALHIDHAVAVARAEPAEAQLRPERMTGQRSLLVSTSHFVFERIELAPNSDWYLSADQETWLYCLSGSATAGQHAIAAGGVVFAEAADVELRAGANGVTCLVAYPGHQGPNAHLLSRHLPSGKRRKADQVAFPQSVPYSDARKD